MKPAKLKEIEILKRLSKPDFKAITELYNQLGPGRKPLTVATINILLEGDSELLVIREQGQIIGMATIGFLPTVSGWYGEITHVVIDEGHRGQGFGTLIMEYAIEQAKKHNVTKLHLTSAAHRSEAHAFYEKLGFKKVDANFYRLTL